jgi:hypothetical protein
MITSLPWRLCSAYGCFVHEQHPIHNDMRGVFWPRSTLSWHLRSTMGIYVYLFYEFRLTDRRKIGFPPTITGSGLYISVGTVWNSSSIRCLLSCSAVCLATLHYCNIYTQTSANIAGLSETGRTPCITPAHRTWRSFRTTRGQYTTLFTLRPQYADLRISGG